MRLVSHLLVCLVLVCLLLPLASGPRRSLHRTHSHSQMRRARVRRCRGESPAHHPVRPCKNALLPPDDDDACDPSRFHAKIAHERLSSLTQDQTNRNSSSPFGSHPLPTAVPRHQTLCILLI
jgi:hypothetical protein